MKRTFTEVLDVIGLEGLSKWVEDNDKSLELETSYTKMEGDAICTSFYIKTLDNLENLDDIVIPETIEEADEDEEWEFDDEEIYYKNEQIPYGNKLLDEYKSLEEIAKHKKLIMDGDKIVSMDLLYNIYDIKGRLVEQTDSLMYREMMFISDDEYISYEYNYACDIISHIKFNKDIDVESVQLTFRKGERPKRYNNYYYRDGENKISCMLKIYEGDVYPSVISLIDEMIGEKENRRIIKERTISIL